MIEQRRQARSCRARAFAGMGAVAGASDILCAVCAGKVRSALEVVD